MRLTARLWHSSTGIAATEFALALPLLLILGLAGVETSNYVLSNLKVSNIAAITADNASRVRESIDETDVNELFLGAELAGKGIDFKDRGRVILYDVEASANGNKQWIRWQRCSGKKSVEPKYGRPQTANGNAIKDGTETYKADRRTPSNNPSSENASKLTGIGPAGKQIAAQPGTAIMVAEVVYDYQPIIPNSFLEGREVSYVSAFNVRQRNNHQLRNNGKVTPASCG